MDITTYIPWLAAGVINVIVFRLLVANPWMAARAEETRMIREGLDQLACELRGVRKGLRSLGDVLLFPDQLELGDALFGKEPGTMERPGMKGETPDGYGTTRGGWHC